MDDFRIPLTTLKRLTITDAIRYRIAIVRRAEQLVGSFEGSSDGDVYTAKAELADELLAEIAQQGAAHENRLARLPERAITPVVDVRLSPKRRRRAR